MTNLVDFFKEFFRIFPASVAKSFEVILSFFLVILFLFLIKGIFFVKNEKRNLKIPTHVFLGFLYGWSIGSLFVV
jgi:cellobiose-specific phosphotransferase system component IIC